jgi:hypothetical protein
MPTAAQLARCAKQFTLEAAIEFPAGFPLNTLNMLKQRLKGRFAWHSGCTRQGKDYRSDYRASRLRFFACFPLVSRRFPAKHAKHAKIMFHATLDP